MQIVAPADWQNHLWVSSFLLCSSARGWLAQIYSNSHNPFHSVTRNSTPAFPRNISLIHSKSHQTCSLSTLSSDEAVVGNGYIVGNKPVDHLQCLKASLFTTFESELTARRIRPGTRYATRLPTPDYVDGPTSHILVLIFGNGLCRW